MDGIPLSAQFAALAVLLGCSAFFSITETAMMAANRHRLRHLAGQGDRGAKLALDLLGRTDKMLGVILLGNNLINAAAATLVSVITIELFGEEKWALSIGTLLVTFAILVFAEITPKILGATHADRLARVLAYVIGPLLRAAYPVVWFVNLFVDALLWLLRLKPKGNAESSRLSVEELRSLVLESGNFIPQQHRAILLNLFELEQLTVADIMIPRGEIEAIDIGAPIEDIKAQLATSFHTRVAVYENDPANIVGVLPQRRLLAEAFAGKVEQATLRERMSEPYFIPAATPIYTQLQFFRDNRQRMGLVVDEYGEIEGLVTLEDIIEELVGKFTTRQSDVGSSLSWNEDGVVLVDGAATLRELNRMLALDLPLDGPRTLNGLIVEHLQDIPEVGVGVRVGNVAMEIVQTQDRKIKMVRLHRPAVE
ncbi:MAG: HlyC/CorC family transporter [Sterolibacteriaceae bacterium]|uniref:HlyC/CorC family transporter n=1 Tax=Sulfuritalea sp. TaxID=2480090 RepID=UPI001A4F9A56|nr:HlyC/CorC family transporter [Sulfuritalea sp.]MBL8478401.1 HlyC/CorC family transporter [Sterolibacteriaceae bacterium]MBN8476778.1 HlyC/CorC family transporter [Sulfuritalea sp.]